MGPSMPISATYPMELQVFCALFHDLMYLGYEECKGSCARWKRRVEEKKRTCKDCAHYSSRGPQEYVGRCYVGDAVCHTAGEAVGCRQWRVKETTGEQEVNYGAGKCKDCGRPWQATILCDECWTKKYGGPYIVVEDDPYPGMPPGKLPDALFSAFALGLRKERGMMYDVTVYEKVHDEDTGVAVGVERIAHYPDVWSDTGAEGAIQKVLQTGELADKDLDLLRVTVVERQLRPFAR